MTTAPIAVLTAAFEASGIGPGVDAKHNAGSVVLSWPAVPIEIVRAAGLCPVAARGGLSATPTADAYLEPGIFPRRLRRLAEAALTGRLSSAARIIVPRTSDPDYKFFLYLREFVRLGIAPELPPVLLFDLLQSQGPDVRSYNAARSRDLAARTRNGQGPLCHAGRCAARDHEGKCSTCGRQTIDGSSSWYAAHQRRRSFSVALRILER